MNVAMNLLKHVLFVNSELETHAYREGQSLDTEIMAMMESAGFFLLCTSDPKVKQYDALFIRNDLDRSKIEAIIDVQVGR